MLGGFGGKWVGVGCEEGLTAKQDICQSSGLRLGGHLFHGSPECRRCHVLNHFGLSETILFLLPCICVAGFSGRCAQLVILLLLLYAVFPTLFCDKGFKNQFQKKVYNLPPYVLNIKLV